MPRSAGSFVSCGSAFDSFASARMAANAGPLLEALPTLKFRLGWSSHSERLPSKVMPLRSCWRCCDAASISSSCSCALASTSFFHSSACSAASYEKGWETMLTAARFPCFYESDFQHAGLF